MDEEWIIPDFASPVRQADVLICRDPHVGQVEEICLVITADCDISKGKFGRQLACLRVISFHDYLRTVWAERKLRKLEKDEAEKLRGQLAKWHTKKIEAESHLSADAALSWLRRDGPEKICADLAIPEQDSRKVQSSLSSFHDALVALDEHVMADALQRYAAFRSSCLNRDIHTCRKEILQQAQKEVLPEDIFLLPSIPQLEMGAAVVLLREVVSVRQEAICYRSADANTNEMFLRVGRLKPTFKYAVSQAFGVLYSRVGLPVDYELRCKTVIEDINQFKWE